MSDAKKKSTPASDARAVCLTCGKDFKSTSKFTHCSECKRFYHSGTTSTCTRFHKTKDADGNTLVHCTPCHTTLTKATKISGEAIAGRRRSNSLQFDLSGNSAPTTPLRTTSGTMSRDGSQSSPGLLASNPEKSEPLGTGVTSGDEQMSLLLSITQQLKQLQKLDKIDSCTESVREIQSSIQGLREDMSNFSGALSNLEKTDESIKTQIEPVSQIPEFIERVEWTETQIGDINRKFAEFQESVDMRMQGHDDAIAAAVDGAAGAGRMRSGSSVTQPGPEALVTTSSGERIVIGGICYGKAADLDLIALTALQRVRPELEKRDVLLVRQLKPRRRPEANRRSSSGGSGPGANGANDSGATEEVGGYPLVVTLYSDNLTRAVLQDQVRTPKLFVSDLAQDKLIKAACVAPVKDSPYYIGEFLPTGSTSFVDMYVSSAGGMGSSPLFVMARSLYGTNPARHLYPLEVRKIWPIFYSRC